MKNSLTTINYFLFSILKNKNKVFSNNIFSVIFNYFLRIVLKNNYQIRRYSLFLKSIFKIFKTRENNFFFFRNLILLCKTIWDEFFCMDMAWYPKANSIIKLGYVINY